MKTSMFCNNNIVITARGEEKDRMFEQRHKGATWG